MKFLQRKVFGKVPLYVVVAFIAVLAFYLWKKKKAAAGANPAANAGADPSQPFPYSSPDMFPTDGYASGPSSSGSNGMFAQDEQAQFNRLYALETANQNQLKTITTRLSNTPHRGSGLPKPTAHQLHLAHLKHQAKVVKKK